VPSEPIPARWPWAWDKTMSEAPVPVGLIFAGGAVLGGIIFGQPWKEAMGNGFIVYVLAMAVLLGRNLLRAGGNIERESNERLAAWRGQFATEVTLNTRSGLEFMLWPPRGSFPTAFTLQVKDPEGRVASGPRGTLVMGDVGRVGDALNWEYPHDYQIPESALVDGTYTATWFASDHVKSIAELTVQRQEGVFLV